MPMETVTRLGPYEILAERTALSVYAKNCRISVNTTDSFSGPSVQIFLTTSVVCIVKSFAGFTIDFFGRMPSMQSRGSMVSALSSTPCDVIAARTTSCIA